MSIKVGQVHTVLNSYLYLSEKATLSKLKTGTVSRSHPKVSIKKGVKKPREASIVLIISDAFEVDEREGVKNNNPQQTFVKLTNI